MILRASPCCAMVPIWDRSAPVSLASRADDDSADLTLAAPMREMKDGGEEAALREIATWSAESPD